MIRIEHTRLEHIPQLVRHQQICFPTFDPNEWMDAEMFAAQLAVYPEGQHVALDGERVVGQSSTFRIAEAIAFAPHTYHTITGHNRFTLHDPHGDWLYGADMSIHPDYRGRGIAKRLYQTRMELVRRLGMRGIIAGGALPGYRFHRDRLSVEAYIAEVVAGRLVDDTLTAQLKSGFTVRGVLYNYVEGGDLVGDHATMLVWEA